MAGIVQPSHLPTVVNCDMLGIVIFMNLSTAGFMPCLLPALGNLDAAVEDV
jgi:hypothetical protein